MCERVLDHTEGLYGNGLCFGRMVNEMCVLLFFLNVFFNRSRSTRRTNRRSCFRFCDDDDEEDVPLWIDIHED